MLAVFNQVYLSYGQNRPVLNNINLSLAEGAFYFLTGPSGAGKSSLLRLFYGAERPTKGTLTLLGQNVSNLKKSDLPAVRRRLGIVFQDFRLISHLTALENAALPLRIAGAEESQIKTHVKELLEWVGLGDRMNALPSELSGGEQQRVAIARAVVNKPKLILADEPTGNVDDESALKLMHLLLELNKLGTAVLLATHQQAMVKRFNKPSLQLKNGELFSTLSWAA